MGTIGAGAIPVHAAPPAPCPSAAPYPSAGLDTASALLTIDPDAVAANWRTLARVAAPAACAAVVKADAYGLGADAIAPRLRDAGCRTFFVATVEEAFALRAHLDDPAVAVLALNGAPPGAEALCAARAVTPVINSLAALARWSAAAAPAPLPLALQVDTGMSRFGLPPAEVEALAAGAVPLGRLAPVLLMSHLAAAERPENGLNAAQRARLLEARDRLDAVLRPGGAGAPVPLSLAASSGIFAGRDLLLDLVRPGAALYGVHPGTAAGDANPMRDAIRLDVRVMQVRTIPAGATVGYGATWTAPAPTRVATLAAGYADGLPRAGGNRGAALLASGARLPVIGRISMDSITVDAGTPDADGLREGDWVTLIGPLRPVDRVAEDSQTIGYEILTSLGRRYRRRHAALDTPPPDASPPHGFLSDASRHREAAPCG